MKALITGGAGFVGANLARRLIADGDRVQAVIRPGSDRWRLQGLESELEISEVDLRDSAAIGELLDRIDGDVYQVAEVVRNLALREVTKGLSAGEKAMLVRARGILVSELSFALNVSEEEALTKLEQQLA